MGDWGKAGTGAAGGAATGAAVGSIIPGYGTAIGAGVGAVAGGLAGYFSGGDDSAPVGAGPDSDRIRALINAGYGGAGGGVARPPGPAWAGNIGAAMSNVSGAGGQDITHLTAPQLQFQDQAFRNAQLQQLQQLQGIASGQQQGAGELAAQRQYANAIAAQQAQARMARGASAALAYRNAANQSAALGSTAAGMGQQSALQDQMNAQGLLGQVGAAGRQGDYSVANANAGYQMGNQQLNSQNYLALLDQLNKMNSQQAGIKASADQASQQRSDAILGSTLTAAGQAAATYAKGKAAGAPASGASGGNSGYTGDSSTWGA